jgi:hypothetical protein
MEPPIGGGSAEQVHLIHTGVFFFLVLNVFAYRLFVLTHALRNFGARRAALPKGAPYVLRSLLVRLRTGSPFDPQSLPKLAAAFLDEERCPGARRLSDDEKAKLKAIRDLSPPPASRK